MSGRLTKSGVALIIIGGTLTVVGLVLFLRVLLALGHLGVPFPTPFSMPGWRNALPVQGAMVGLVLLGVGSYLVKIGLGLTLVGHSDSIASWLRRLVRGERAEQSCPNCGAAVPSTANFCSQCGTRL
ncbi:MAG: zinc ribbon domain-containing protein [Firmicutes bacterium]|nr:zinc ribbon domain-containing protein [Bacillota bacterium]